MLLIVPHVLPHVAAAEAVNCRVVAPAMDGVSGAMVKVPEDATLSVAVAV